MNSQTSAMLYVSSDFMKAYRHIVVFFFFASCASKDNEIEKESNRDTAIAAIPKSENHRIGGSTFHYVWAVDFDGKTKKRNHHLKEADISIDSLIKGLNELYDNIFLEKLKISHDTAYLVIKDSEFLTQRMGSSGAAQYLASTVINITSVKGIRFVNLNFEEGDHAGPGIWSMADFKRKGYRIKPLLTTLCKTATGQQIF